MDKREEFAIVMAFTNQQKVLDMGMTLADLASRIGGDALADNVVVWDRYVYRTSMVAKLSDQSVTETSKRLMSQIDQRVLNLNVSVVELTKTLANSKLDQVAGWIWDHDRMTFIVARGGDIAQAPQVG